MVAASIYVYMQFFPTLPALILVAQFDWFFAHGSPPLIYLTMNKTIRKECGQLFRHVFKVETTRVSPAGNDSVARTRNPISSLMHAGSGSRKEEVPGANERSNAGNH